MLSILIKNNLKLMLRNKFMIFIMLLGPILVTAALSSGFSSLMSKYQLSDHVNVGYTAKNSSDLDLIENIKPIADDNGIELKQYDTTDYQAALNSDDFDVFVVFDQNTYTIYQNKDHKIEADTTGYFLTTVYQNSAFLSAKMTSSTQAQPGTVEYSKEIIPKAPTPESSDYYGIIEIVYFLWCGIVALTAVITSERKNHIQTRFHLSMMSRFKLFLGKAIPCTAAIFVESVISSVICALLFQVHWGNIAGSLFILLLGSIAASCLGILLFYLFQNAILAVISAFSLSWIFGFIGGTFETYMYSSFSETIKRCSPIYFMNRTLVEYSTTGSSNHTIPAIIYLVLFSIVCGLAGILLMNKRMEEQ